MKIQQMIAACGAATLFLSALTLCGAMAQQTAKACEEQWKANKASIQASGKKKKDFISECRGAAATSTAAPAREPAAKPAKTTTSSTTAKACQEQWKANKASIQASGKKKKDFISECRGIAATSATAPTREPAPKPAKTTTSSTTAAPTRTVGVGAPAAAKQYSTEGAAKLRCPMDTVVWVNLRSKIYHFSSYKNYGNTESGAYICERDTAAAGFRAAKNEKHP